MIPKLPAKPWISGGLYSEEWLETWWQKFMIPWHKKVFEGAIKVYTKSPRLELGTRLWEGQGTFDTHKALCIQIQPIKEETAEDILGQIIYCMEKGFEYRVEHSDKLIQKAKEFLEKKK